MDKRDRNYRIDPLVMDAAGVPSDALQRYRRVSDITEIHKDNL